MQETLANDPADFVKKNNGVTMICKNVVSRSGSCVLDFEEGEGVCNGGHTYFAIVNSPSGVGDDALVHLEALQLPPSLSGEGKKQEITRIARARNNNNRLLLRSEADFLDYYEPLKRFLDNPTFVSWHEGDSNAVSDSVTADDFIRVLSALDPKKYYHPEYNPTAKTHKAAVTAGKSVNYQWFQDSEEWRTTGQPGPAPLAHVGPLSNDILHLRDSIAETFAGTIPGTRFRLMRLYQDQIKNKVRHSLTNPSAIGHAPPITVEIMLLGLFRTNVWLHFDKQANPDLVGWVISPNRLWDLQLRRAQVLESLGESYNDADEDLIRFVRIDAPYRADIYQPGVGQPFPNNPEVVYEIPSGGKYLRMDTSANSTHYLVPGTPDTMLPISSNVASGVVFYRAT
jgi:hypothetical protein